MIVHAVRHLTAEGANELIPKLRPQDVEELNIWGSTAQEALNLILLDAMSRGNIGEAWEVEMDGHIVGCFGYHIAGGVIYSLWQPLTLKQSRLVLRQTKEWVRRCLLRSRCLSLHNYVHARNTPAIKWIDASGCFELHRHNPTYVGEHKLFYFRTRSVH